MSRNNDKERIRQICDNKVSMTYFLRVIVGLNHPAINGKNLTHNDVAFLFPTLKRTSFEYTLLHPESLYMGDVVIVEDTKGRMIPYINPHIILDKEEDYYFSDEMPDNGDQIKEIPDINKINLNELSLEELAILLRTYTQAHINSARRKVYKELASRPDSKIAIREEKCKTIRKENKYKNNMIDEEMGDEEYDQHKRK